MYALLGFFRFLDVAEPNCFDATVQSHAWCWPRRSYYHCGSSRLQSKSRQLGECAVLARNIKSSDGHWSTSRESSKLEERRGFSCSYFLACIHVLMIFFLAVQNPLCAEKGSGSHSHPGSAAKLVAEEKISNYLASYH